MFFTPGRRLDLFCFGEFPGDLSDGADFHLPVITFPAFGLQTQFARVERCGGGAIQPLGVVQAQDNPAVDDMDAVPVERDQINCVPFTLRFLSVHNMRAVIADGLLLEEK